MKRKKLWFCILLVAVVFIIALMIPICVTSTNGIKDNYKIFSKISDLDNIEDFKYNDSSKKDKYLNNLVYLENRNYLITFKGDNYRVYAYIFNDVTDSQKYYKNRTGKKYDRNYGFSSGGNFYFTNHVIVYKDECVYRIEGGYYGKYIEFIKAINIHLPENLK